MRAIFLLPALLVLAGCTTWTKPGATQYEFDRDSSQCQAQAYQQFPVRMVADYNPLLQQAPSYNTQCQAIGDFTNCQTQPSINSMSQFHTEHDINIDGRNSAYQACMYGLGWHQQRGQ